jgi:hypothetical protein
MPLFATLPAALTTIGMGAGLAGTGMSIAGGQQAKSAMANTRAEFNAKEADLQAKNNVLFRNSLAQSTPEVAAQQMQTGANQRGSIWNNLQSASTPVASALPATGASTTSGKAGARASSAGNAWNTMNATAAAKEGGYGDWETQQAIKNADVTQKMGVNTDFAQGNARLEPLELQVASEAGDKLSGWGNIVSSLGMLTGLAGATGAFASAPAATLPVGTDVGFGGGMTSAQLARQLGSPIFTAGYSGTNPGVWPYLYR